ncbi:transcription/translation regulatory transformer protein RfaH [Aliidiomarina celeris]|uniref:transcription/translation regulatory transformer protein RfaH n=1 Tax=Aliidiomarina celeris TaxID=2249428 RepID=UPI0013005783|nr:transcription/translation regulatory transformer protein RfaH [Aliidiomarina celeris]
MSTWYLLHCKARQEERARLNIENQGYITCLPLLTREKILRKKRTQVNEALFPNYLFVQVNPNTVNFNALRSTRGINGVVRFGGVPAEVPEGIMREMLAMESAYEEQQQSGTKQIVSAFQPGSLVEVTEGPFTGLKAIYQLPKGEDRCLVLLDMLGKQQRIELEERVLRA